MNKPLHIPISLIVLVFSLTGILQAQIVTAPLGSNARQKQTFRQVENQLKSNRSLTDTLQIPFIDDFSNEGYAPLNTKWIDYAVFVNQQYAIKPPSIGVATFDGLNAKGEPYSSSNIQGSADTLTSRYINLNFPPSDSIYLSFFYQPKGRGNFPEYIDTFLLEFKNPDDTLWTWMWSSKGEDYPQLPRDFKQVMIPVNDTAFLKNGFQFRFRNYAQLNGSWDHWHLDYVRLDKNRYRNDTNLLDYSFMYPPSSLLKTYQSVPLSHFLPNADANMDTTFRISWTSQAATSDFKLYTYYFENQEFPEVIRDSLRASRGPILPRQEYSFTESVKYTYEDPGTEWTEFQLKHLINLNIGDQIPQNDTAVYRQVLSNYYALDDGTAEERLSINTNGGGFVAQKFDTYLGDTLRSIQYYFNRVNDQVSDKPFYIMVWAAGANEPGQILVNEGVQYPAYSGLDVYYTYELETPVYLPAGTYYIGWAQNTGFEMNVGFDRNINNNDRIFYNLDGNWYNYSAQTGTLMLRPLFRYAQDIYVGQESPMGKSSDWQLYPNPASLYTTLKTPAGLIAPTLSVFDVSGRKVAVQSIESNNTSIQLNALPAGVYFLELRSLNGRVGDVKRLMVNPER